MYLVATCIAPQMIDHDNINTRYTKILSYEYSQKFAKRHLIC